MPSRSARKRKRAKRRRYEQSAAGQRALKRRAINHVRFCPKEKDRWWFSNDPDWEPSHYLKCQRCMLEMVVYPERNQVHVEGVGVLPYQPSALDLLSLIKILD